MANRKFSQFTAGGASQVPTDVLVGLDLSQASALQNTKWTLNNLFAKPTLNITDGAMRFGAPGSAPAVSAAAEGSIYFDGTQFQVSSNAGAYTPLGDVSGSFTSGQVVYANGTKSLTGSSGFTFAANALTLGTAGTPGGLRLVGTSGNYWNLASNAPAGNRTLYFPDSTTPTTGNFLFVGTFGATVVTDWSTGLTWSNTTKQLTVTAALDDVIGLGVQNTSAGTAAQCQVGFTANGGAISLLSLTGTNFSTSGIYHANQLYWRGTTGITDITFALDDASTNFRFAVNNVVAASINATSTEGLVLGIASSLTGRIKLFNSAGATYTQLSAGNAASSLNYILPAAAPTAGQYLQAAAPVGSNVTLTWATVSGGGSPGGSTTQIQYNNAGSFGGISTFTTDGSVVTMTRAGISNTSTDGIVLTNTTAAAAGVQQWSPRLHWTGQGWKTSAGGASQSVDCIAELVPVQGITTPTSNLIFSFASNAGPYTARYTFGNTGNLTVDGNVISPVLTAGTASSVTGNLTLYNSGTANATTLQAGAAASALTFVWPIADPTAGQVLSASAPSGGVVTLSWAAAGGGTTINSTNGQLPYRVNSTTFGDSAFASNALNSTYLQATSGISGAGLTLAVAGGGTNEDLFFAPKGTGKTVISSGLLAVGGTSAATPGIKNVGDFGYGVALEARRLDDSNAAPFRASHVITINDFALSTGSINWTGTGIARPSSGVLRITTASTGAGQLLIGTSSQSASAQLSIYSADSTRAALLAQGASGAADGQAVAQINSSAANLFTVLNDGRVYGTALHNNSGAVTGTTNQYIASGTYTPSVTAVANVASGGTGGDLPWIRVGNVVTVSGNATIQATTGAVTTQLRISLPIASDLAAASDLNGVVATDDTVSGSSGQVIADTVNNAALISFVPATNSNLDYSFTFTYLIK